MKKNIFFYFPDHPHSNSRSPWSTLVTHGNWILEMEHFMALKLISSSWMPSSVHTSVPPSSWTSNSQKGSTYITWRELCVITFPCLWHHVITSLTKFWVSFVEKLAGGGGGGKIQKDPPPKKKRVVWRAHLEFQKVNGPPGCHFGALVKFGLGL